MFVFQEQLQSYAKRVTAALDAILTPYLQKSEIARPKLLLEAMRYAVLSPAKRLRPFLLAQTTQLLHGSELVAMRIGCAVEILHCYSLVHDDLPAMDNDDLRRGQPTTHKKFDEATAILTGDALQTLAFDIIADSQTELSPTIKLQLILELSRAAGIGGMVGGQFFDLQNENKAANEQDILRTHSMKTGALFAFSAKAGGIISNCSENDLSRLEAFGSAIGLGFQLADDILDLTSDTQKLGKTAGKDASAGKSTIASLYGLELARHQLDGLLQEAKALLEPFGKKAETLVAMTDFIKDRSF